MIPSALERWGPSVETALQAILPPEEQEPVELHRAMRYSVLAAGKRLRPILALCAYRACGGDDPESVLPAAAALELLHTYSLIHDDLPSMDDDDLRRGRPSSHVVFGEAVAILAGDALQTLAFQVLASYPAGARLSARRTRVCREMALALGSVGMAGGQVLDLRLTGSGGGVSADDLLRVHRLKTGRFLEAALQSGAFWAGARTRERQALLSYGRAMGLAFQIVDDILDVTATSEALGKTAGKDAAQGKATFPALWGIEESEQEAQRLLSEALRALAPLGPDSQELRELAHFIVNRGR